MRPDPKQEIVDINSLETDPQNAVDHDDHNRQEVRKLIEKHGQVIPIVVDPESRIIAKGNLTWSVMKELGYEEVWVNWVGYESDVARRAYAAGDNRVGELHEWRWDVVAQLVDEMAQLAEDAAQIVVIPGFTDEELYLLTQTSFEAAAPVAGAFGQTGSSRGVTSRVFSLSEEAAEVLDRALKMAGERVPGDKKGDALVAVAQHYIDTIE